MKNLHLLMLTALVSASSVAWAQTNTVDLSKVSENTLTVTDGQILTGTLGDYCNITIADGASITLSNATISLASNFSFQYAGLTCLGNATIILEGENTVKGFYNSYPGIYVPKDATLTIKGSGSIEAKGEMNGCGIGGQFSTKAEHASGNIVIESGTINATGGFQAAGIGGAGNLTSGNITIKGGTVTAQGGEYAPGIGSGKGNTAGNITITKDVVKVTSIRGEYAPYCIGVAVNGKCGTITLGDITITEGVKGETCTYQPSLKTYNVEFNPNGGSGEMASVNLLPGFQTKISQNAFTRSGYAFVG